MNFYDLCRDLRVTPEERVALVYHLSAIRARRTVERLIPSPDGAMALYAALLLRLERPSLEVSDVGR